MSESNEIVFIPSGTSVYPTLILEQQETFWQIVQEVAETESEYGANLDFDDKYLNYYCPFCEGVILTSNFARGEPFPHESDCIVTKARQLMEWRKAQPCIELKIKEV